MARSLVERVRFALRVAFRRNGALCWAFVFCLSGLLATGAAWAYISLQMAAVSYGEVGGPVKLVNPVSEINSGRNAHELERFSASRLPAQLQTFARKAGLAVDEALFSLDLANSETMSGSRYHASLSIRGRYKDIRAFLGEVLDVGASLSLDSLSCFRDGPQDLEVRCDIQLSAYYLGEPESDGR